MPEPGRAVEQWLRAAVESAPSGLLMIDQDARIVLVNREIERMFGYAREELLGKPIDLLVPERFRQNHPAFRAGFMKSPTVRSMGVGRELYGLRRDGSEVPIEIGLTPIATDDGMFVLSAIVDITARKRAELRFRAAVESSPNGMVMVDAGGRIVLVNREVERMFGYARAELLGQQIEMLVPDRFRRGHPKDRAEFVADPHARSMGAGRDLFGLRKDGSEFPVEIGLNPMETDEGLFVLGSIVDITARKRFEADQRQLEEQLRHSQKMEAVGTLAGGIAHDFNNILGAIIGFAELLHESVAGAQAKADLRELLKASERGKLLVQRILAFSRRQDVQRRPLALAATIEEATRLLRSSLPATIDIRLNVDPASPRVLADPTAVHQVIMNLGTNAAHAMPRGGVFEVTVEPVYVRDSVARAHPDLHEGPYTVVTVRDTGSGMDRSTQQRAFEPFFTTKGPGEGTGLGLAVVHRIIHEHEGAVELDSEIGRGTSFRCYFPALVSDQDEALHEASDIRRGRGERILFVDDEPALVRVNERRLSGIGYFVTTATSPVTAVELFRAQPDNFDLVVTDYWMPHLVGIDLARAIHDVRPDVPILLLTGFMDDLPEETLRAAGVRRVVKKPVTGQELAEVLSEVLTEASRKVARPLA
jgi:PAS domain S-box-containing protein